MRLLGAVGACVLGLVTGLAVGLSSVALHHYWWGLLLAIAATATTAYALPPGWWRIPFAVGWVGMVGYLAFPRDEGDYVIAADPNGYALLGFAVALLVAAMVTPGQFRRGGAPRRRRRLPRMTR